MTDFLIRLETESDREGIEELLLEAFPSPSEAELVRQLREDDDVVFSLVAVGGGEVIGQALFSKLLAPSGALALGRGAFLCHTYRDFFLGRLFIM